MANSSTNNKNKGKKAYKQKKKVLGFDLTDMETRIAFYAFIVIAAALLVLLIAGFALGISRCGSPEVPEGEPETPTVPAITAISDADVSGADADSFM